MTMSALDAAEPPSVPRIASELRVPGRGVAWPVVLAFGLAVATCGITVAMRDHAALVFAASPLTFAAGALVGRHGRDLFRRRHEPLGNPEARDAPDPTVDAEPDVPAESTASAPPIAHPGADALVRDLSDYHHFSSLLIRQIRSVTEVTEHAAEQILDGLVKVDGQVTALLTYIKGSASGEQAAEAIADIEAQLRGCQDLLDSLAEGQRINAALGREQLARLAEETTDVLNVIKVVNDIARATKMISFNVAIEAARSGDAGAGFAAIGQEVRRLASQVQDLATDVHSRIEKLMHTVNVELRSRAEQREAAERASIANFANTLKVLAASLLDVMNRQHMIMSRVEQENQAVAAPLMAVMGSIQFQDIVRQQLEQVASMVSAVDDHLTGLADPETSTAVSPPQLRSLIDGFLASYVMDRQRDAHETNRAQAPSGAAAPSIELF